MPVVKGGVWTNIEDEILKASVSKYGLNQWARVSSLLNRKTAKQCKARWAEWLDPAIRKIEWSREEDEKLLHLAKLMPTQWRTIAPIVGRTATQCLERYQKLLDEAEARESNEFGLGGPEGGEAAPPSADDVRKLRPGELDPDPESKPARPDTVDMDEDEKEMLSEARARLANTQGKKAKRKARERQLEESRRLAVLQKRRELKSAGINIKVTTKKKGQMDYNADIPFEKAPAPGFHDTQDEMKQNEREREMFDPRKQQLANKRKADAQDEGQDSNKKQKGNKDSGAAAAAAAAKAAQAQRVREAEQSSKRRGLVLPAPQVSESELEDIVKMGMSGERATAQAQDADNDTTRGLISNYNRTVGATPMRTPMAAKGEDTIANELRNAKARAGNQSVLLGGETAGVDEGSNTTGYGSLAPGQQAVSTPNPMATPRVGMGATPQQGGPSATPMRTPRDNFKLNQDGSMQLVGQTPKEMRMREMAMRGSLQDKLASLPKAKQVDYDLELPEEREEAGGTASLSEEDAAARDKRLAAQAQAQAMADFRRQSQVVQKGLPRPKVVDAQAMLKAAGDLPDAIEQNIATGMSRLMANDGLKFGGTRVQGQVGPTDDLSEEQMSNARTEVLLQLQADSSADNSSEGFRTAFASEWQKAHRDQIIPGLAGYAEDEADEQQILVSAFDRVQDDISALSEKGEKLQKKLMVHHGGYMNRQKVLAGKLGEAWTFLRDVERESQTTRYVQMLERAAVGERLEKLREQVALVSRREREAQEVFRLRKQELERLG
ncbi:hypothetical protein MBLNU230_g2325t1 [Neophaeotheca triangularis]